MSEKKRDIKADYEAAYRHEHAGYVAVGRDKEAAVVAKILKDQFGVDVEKKASSAKAAAKAASAPERADEKAPEDTAEKKPAPRQEPAKKSAAKKG